MPGHPYAAEGSRDSSSDADASATINRIQRADNDSSQESIS
jgi:hypothetical protein